MKNPLSQDVEDLKVVLDQTIIDTALNSVHVRVLQSAFLGVCEELLSPEAYKNLCTNYLSELKQRTDEALEGLEDVLFEPGTKVLKLKADNHFQIGAMKRDLGVHNEVL